MSFIPFDRMKDRVQIGRSESDTAFFNDLLLHGELLTKILVTGLLAAVKDDRHIQSYRVAHGLVRADGLGEWVTALDDLLIGPTSSYLDQTARDEKRELTQRVSAPEWQYSAALLLHECLDVLGIDTDPLPTKVAARRFFADFVLLRNKTRGHGATMPHKYGRTCEKLAAAIELIEAHYSLFRRPWAYIHRNLSGKYRVTKLTDDSAPFEHLKRTSDVSLENGVYLHLSDFHRVTLLESDSDISDFFLPNGGFSSTKYELLSYITGDRLQGDSNKYRAPIEELPKSESQSLGQLEVVGHSFSNLPEPPQHYVTRTDLETELLAQLYLPDRHPIITLTGAGGVGKTFLSLHVLHKLARDSSHRYAAIIWFSARDIDLLPEGPKLVKPHLLTIDECAKEFLALVGPNTASSSELKPSDLFSAQMTKSDIGPTLFVFDNFETVKNPAEIYTWLDTFIRLPNRILITTRRRDFVGDYPISVTGMSEEECNELISTTASSLGIVSLITEEYRDELVRESDGHPYVIKMLLGEVAKRRTRQKVRRIIAGQDSMLIALFERTFSSLTPAAQRLFLTLCNWHSTLPEIAVEAIVLRPSNERINFRDAVEELIRSSLIEQTLTSDGELIINVPLAARVFGKRKLDVSPWKPAVVADSELLQLLGAAQKSDARQGIALRIERLFREAARSIQSGKYRIEDVQPILEFISQHYAKGWLLLADLYDEDGPNHNVDAVKQFLRRFLEQPAAEVEISRVWKRLADVCADSRDFLGEIHSLSSICKVPGTPTYVISNTANRLNGILRSGSHGLGKEELRIVLNDVVSEFETRRKEFDADDHSRLAWLYMNLHDEVSARRIAEEGLEIEPFNAHCSNLIDRLAR